MAKRIRQTIEFDLGTMLHIERQIGDKSLRGTSKIIGAHEPRYLLIDLPFAYGKPMFSTAGDNCVVRFLHQGTLLGFRADVIKIFFDPFPMVLIEYPKEIEEMALRKHERLSCSLPARLTIEKPQGAEMKAYLESLRAPKSSDDGLSALIAESMDDSVPLTPTAPLNATVIDLAEGGCQLAIMMFDPQNFGEKALEMRKTIPVAERSNYHARALRVSCAKGRPAHLDMELPLPAKGLFPDVACTLRWNKTLGDHFLVGVSFEENSAPVREAARAIIDYQQKYFVRQFEPLA